MRIPSYQIRNVLNQYSAQLSAGIIKTNPDDSQRPGFSDLYLLTEKKRMEIIDRITTGIVEKISRLNFKERQGQMTESTSGARPSGRQTPVGLDEKQFVFNAIDENNQKITTTILVENPGFLTEQFEKQASEAVDNKTK